ncbi:MAG TPA: hypothetical protein VGR78_10890 [Verrucomicrobiae bacterium]|jgi:hypothetical protein|nr:hypothetical protein [Verrucomicrobiae bacterium]
MPDGEQKKRSVWRRVLFSCRVAALLALLSVAAVFVWANYVRVPNFITSMVRDELRARNFSFEFSRLHLKGFRRLVAEDLRLGAFDATNGPTARAREAEILLNTDKLKQWRFEISGVRIKNGELTLPLGPPLHPMKVITISHIQSEMDFQDDDTVRVSQFLADALGAKAKASGTFRNFSQMRRGAGKAAGSDWQKQLADISQVIEELEFSSPPQISVTFNTDATNVAQTRATVAIRARKTSSQWGKLEALDLTSGVFPLSTNGVEAVFLLQAAGFRGSSNACESVHLEATSVWTSAMDQLLTNHVSARVSKVDSIWLKTPLVSLELSSSQPSLNSAISSTLFAATEALEFAKVRIATNSLHASFSHDLPFPSPASWLGTALSRSPAPEARTNGQNFSGEWQFRAEALEAGNAGIGSLELSGKLASRHEPAVVPASAGFWRAFAPLQIPWRGAISNIIAPDMLIASVQFSGDWDFPKLAISGLEAELYGGSFQANSALDVLTREALVSAEAQFDYAKLAGLLDKNVRDWFTQFAWERPPYVQAVTRFRVPPWTNSWAAAMKIILPSLQLDGQFTGPASYRGISVDNIESHFSFADSVWNLPDLKISRPEGQALLIYQGNVANQEFACQIESQIDPGAFRDLFPEDQQGAFDFLKFSVPPVIEGEVFGSWEHADQIRFKGSLQATNFFVKEQLFTDVRAELAYANKILECTNALVHRGKEEMHAPYLRVDIPAEVMFVTNVVSTIDPWVAMSLVGEDAYDAIDPYRFAKTPTVRVEGNVPLRHWSKANLHFHVTGDDFSFWKLHMANIAGDVWWKADYLWLSNVVANFYGGEARWSGSFFIEKKHAQYSFTGITTNTDLHPLVADIFGTNKVEGTLGGALLITSANTGDEKSWNGRGSAVLKDGFLWSIPIFGVFSPILDAVVPGVGNNKISSGSGDFAITNSVIHTRNMQVRAPAFRLDYKGKIDMDGKLEARVDAEILRDAWVFGKLFSTALWPVAKAFEANISGKIQEPKTTFRFFPKVVFAPFKALNALGEAIKAKEKPAQPEPVSGTAPPLAAPPTQPK